MAAAAASFTIGKANAAEPTDTASLAGRFARIDDEARPQVWWHWMDGNVTREGIRKDLEWMKASGIGGLHQFDAGGINMPRAVKEKLPYMTEGWKDAFRYALDVADSLGLEVTIASAPGWSSTGGTWVRPEDAVKKLEWRSIDIRSNGKVEARLPELYRTVGPYQDCFQGNDRIEVKPYGEDLFVMAVRKSGKDLSMEEMGARLTQDDSTITCCFTKARKIKALTLKTGSTPGRPRSGEIRYRSILEASSDGKTWKEIHRIAPGNLPYMTENIKPVKAKYFRVKGEKLESLVLHTVERISHSEEAGGFSVIHDFGRYRTQDGLKGTAKGIDLTQFMDEGGTLRCNLPKGRWRIYRFGWSITGKINHPASPEATGLEVDKLDPDAWMDYFHTYMDMYREAAGGRMGKNGIQNLLIDSYEAGSYTWTRRMVEEFQARRGYDPTPWLPVLAGEIIRSSDSSEAFLWDWRKTLGELFCENYSRIREIVDEYELRGYFCETHEGARAFTGDGMDPKIGATTPMAAIWMQDTPTGSKAPAAICDIKESASVAHIYGKKDVAAESFTVNGDEGRAYTYCPENMKYIADIAMSAGLTKFVVHESASQPNDTYLPGMQLFRYGQWLHRNETWASYAGVFFDYLARSCTMLRQGNHVADILLYYGEDSNATAQYGGDTFDTLPDVPEGYDYDFANPTVVRTALKASSGLLTSPSGSEYSIFWMDRNTATMSTDILLKIKEFADAGVMICGQEPVRGAGMNCDMELFRSLVNDIWHSGRSNVAPTLREGISRLGLKPDFSSTEEGMKYVHRTAGDGTQIYWVRNFSGSDALVSLSFRDAATHCSIFIPETGRACEVEGLAGDGSLSLPLKATDAVFVVFSPERVAEPLEGSLEEFMGYTSLPGFERVRKMDLKWQVSFDQKGGQKAGTELTELHSWTEEDNPVIRYYAGTAIYTTSFEMTEEDLQASGSFLMDLGSVKNIAEVEVNGMPAGVLWKAPFRTSDIKPFLKAGENSLTIKVTNVWRNRMIGDVQKDEKHPVTAIRRFYKATDEPIPSGLLGPVTLMGSSLNGK